MKYFFTVLLFSVLAVGKLDASQKSPLTTTLDAEIIKAQNEYLQHVGDVEMYKRPSNMTERERELAGRRAEGARDRALIKLRDLQAVHASAQQQETRTVTSSLVIKIQEQLATVSIQNASDLAAVNKTLELLVQLQQGQQKAT